MPTDLPDTAARNRRRRRRIVAPVVMTIIYLLLLAWNMATFDAGFILSAFSTGRQMDEYNPMEPSNRPTAGPNWPGRFAQW